MITPVLLCGGSGTRLWPLSRRSYPKQFAPLLGSGSLFQQAALRLTGPDFAPPVIVTASDFRFIVTEQLAAVAVDPGAILIEPQARNTCAAILAAALHLPPDALLLVSPSDHALPDVEAFHRAIAQGVDAARQGRIVTFGITPDRAETGFGWLEAEGPGVSPLRRFVEKPALEDAQAMLQSGHFLWNAGLFLCRADTLIAAADRHCPDILAAVRAALQAARPDLGFLRLDADAWAGLPDLSIDYAVMERADNLTVVPFAGAWSDMGGWDAVWQGSPRCAQGVARHGAATAIDCHDSLLRSESPGQEIVGIGLRDIVAVAMPDAVLVMDRHRAQEARLAVTALRARNATQADTFPRAHRPWGWFETLALADRFQVKRITVHPGAALSLQSHVHRSEHWIVVSGTARVILDGTEQLVTENQSIYVPLGAVHRLENPGKVPMVLIEVQTGSYLAEDDITRYADFYART